MKKSLLFTILLTLLLPVVYSFGEMNVFVESPPIIYDYSISPENPEDNGSLICQYEVFDTGNYIVSVLWSTVDGRAHEGAVLPYELTRAGDNWTCTITASGKYGISEQSLSIIISTNSHEDPLITGSFIQESDNSQESEPTTSIFYRLYLFISSII